MASRMAEIEIQTGLRENTTGFVELFAEVASTDPLSAFLLVVGAVLVVFSAGLVGLMTLGAAGSSISRLFPTPAGPRQRDR